MNNSTCLYCGAEKAENDDLGVYICDTFHYHNGSIVRDYTCYERQLAAKEEEIEALRDAINKIAANLELAIKAKGVK